MLFVGGCQSTPFSNTSAANGTFAGIIGWASSALANSWMIVKSCGSIGLYKSDKLVVNASLSGLVALLIRASMKSQSSQVVSPQWRCYVNRSDNNNQYAYISPVSPYKLLWNESDQVAFRINDMAYETVLTNWKPLLYPPAATSLFVRNPRTKNKPLCYFRQSTS